MYNRMLLDRLSNATSVRGTAVGAFDVRHRRGARDLLRAVGAAELSPLIQSLAFDEDSLLEGISLMTPGDIQITFLAGHKLVASIVLIAPGFLRWDGLPFDARLLEPRSVETWLVARGWRGFGGAPPNEPAA